MDFLADGVRRAFTLLFSGEVLVCGGMGEGLYGPLNGGKRARFTLEALSTPGSRSARFRLQNDDVILVQ